MEPVVVAVAVASVAAGALAGWIGRSYHSRNVVPRLDADAVLRNLDAIRTAAQMTERTTASIKADIDPGIAREREKRTLYRTKLEDALHAVYAARAECQHRMSAMAIADHDLANNDDAANRLAVSVALYFQDLAPLRRSLMQAYYNIQRDSAEVNSLWRLYRMRSDVADAASLPGLQATHESKCAPLNVAIAINWRGLLAAVIAFEKATVALMPKYLPPG